MGGSVKLLLSALSMLILSCLAHAEPRLEVKHSFKSPFLMFRGYLPNWDFSGSAVITEEYVRLTPAIKSRTGSIWNLEQVHMRNWEVVLEFRIGGGGKAGADGMAFWYSPDFKQEGGVFGMRDQWHGLGIIFDTFDNDAMRDNPMIVAVLNDGTKTWEGDGKSIQYGGCHAQFRNPYKNVKVRVINFDGVVEIFVDTVGNGIWEPCVPPHRLDLPTGYHFGLTAATGGLFDNHDVYAFETYNLDEPEDTRFQQQPLPTQQPPQQQYQQQQQQQQQQQYQEQPPAQYEEQQQEQQQQDYPDQNEQQAQDPNQDVLRRLQNINNAGGGNTRPREFGRVVPKNSNVRSTKQDTENYQQQNQEYEQQQTQQRVQQNENANNADLLETVRLLQKLNQKVESVQSSVHNIPQATNSASLGQIKEQLEQVVAQQAVFAEAFGNLLNSVATKSDVELIRNVAKQEQNEFRSALNDVKAAVNKGGNTDHIQRLVEDISNTVKNLKHNVEATRDSSKKIADSIVQNQQEINANIQKSTSFGFWTYFLFVQAIFIFGFIWYRKHKDDNNKKLL